MTTSTSLQKKRFARIFSSSCGFTLFEMLAGVVIGFLVVIMIYRTFSAVLSTTREAEEVLLFSSQSSGFFTLFEKTISFADRDSSENFFSSDRLTITVAKGLSPKRILFSVEESNGVQDLLCTEEDLLFSTEYIWTALSGLRDISFSYYEDGEWKDSWEKDLFPAAIRISFNDGHRTLSFPVLCGSAPDENE
jgi:hypothetical protein